MVTYECAVIHQRGTAIELQITDSTPVHDLLDKLSASIAELGASASKLPGGDLYYWRFYGLGDDVERAWAIIVDHFVSCGWASLDDRNQNHSRTMCFGLVQAEHREKVAEETLSCVRMV
jgi:hypothetical protein